VLYKIIISETLEFFWTIPLFLQFCTYTFKTHFMNDAILCFSNLFEGSASLKIIIALFNTSSTCHFKDTQPWQVTGHSVHKASGSSSNKSLLNGTTCFKKCKQLFLHQHSLLPRDIWTQCYKTFYRRNLRIFVIS